MKVPNLLEDTVISTRTIIPYVSSFVGFYTFFFICFSKKHRKT